MQDTRRGMLIVLEGGEGSGKDANIAYLQEKLAHRDDILFTREPGGTVIGEGIRAVLMDHGSHGMSVETELLMFMAARAQLMHEVIRPALEAGSHVVANRFGLSTVAYQIYRKERHEYRDFLNILSTQVVGDVTPHYVLLDVAPEVGIARTKSRNGEITRFDVEPLEVHERVRQGYHDAIRDFPHVVIDANRELEIVNEDVYKYVSSHLP
ncbi:MAG: dTMP kinase [Candidatus Pacebacteria bacterium]|nr:dTMP kinase [Candidatus Paceibacterota bacterium]